MPMKYMGLMCIRSSGYDMHKGVETFQDTCAVARWLLINARRIIICLGIRMKHIS